MFDCKNICRLCIKTSDILQPIFDKEYESPIPLHKQIYFCTSIKVLETDKASLAICMDCINSLTFVSEFKINCQKSDQKLCEMLVNNTLTVEEVIDNQDKLLDTESDCCNNVVSLTKSYQIETKELDSNKLLNTLYDSTKAENDNDNKLPDMNSILTEGDIICIPNIEQLAEIQLPHQNIETVKHFKKDVNVSNTVQNLKTHRKPKVNKNAKRIRRPQQCQECGKFVTMLKLHMLVHTGVKAYKCEFCGKCYAQLSHYKCHVNIHTKAIKYKCNLCSKDFTSRTSLKFHKISHSDAKNYPCPLCNMFFRYPKSLYEHKKMHTQNHDFICNICNKGFVTKYALNVHIQFHNKIKTHECKICHSFFSTSSSLIKHKEIHSKSKSFQCNYCEEIFSLQRVLNGHVRKVHEIQGTTGVDVCNVCEKKFPTTTSLRRHIKTHIAGQWNCAHCEKIYTSVSGLKNHLKKQHQMISSIPIDNFNCELSQENFNSTNGLENHMMQQHFVDARFIFNCGMCNSEFDENSDYQNHINRCLTNVLDS